MAPKQLSDEDYINIIEKAYEEAWEIANSTEGWKLVKTTPEGDIIEAKKVKSGRKVHRCTSILPLSPKNFIKHLQDRENYAKWNETLTAFQILKQINEKVYISYQISDDLGPGGFLSKRDFVVGLKDDWKGEAYVQAGVSVDYPAPKTDSKLVRGFSHPGAEIVRPVDGKLDECQYVWLIDLDFKVWLPSAVLDSNTPPEIIRFLQCARKLK